MRFGWPHLGWSGGLLAALVLSGCGAPAAHPGDTTLTLSPSSGRPGTLVTVSGYVSSVTAQRPATWPWGQIGFGGFAAGLVSNTHATWSTKRPGHFTAVFRVPETAWWTAHGERTLAPGAYGVGFRCFGVPETKPQQRRCLSGPNQLQATFTLVGPVTPPPSHASVTVSPVHAEPGQHVTVGGWAPLTRLFGQPLGYSLMWGEGTTAVGDVQQALNGRLSGSFQVPAYVEGAPVAVGPVALTLAPLAVSPAAPVAYTPTFRCWPASSGLRCAPARSKSAANPMPSSWDPRGTWWPPTDRCG